MAEIVGIGSAIAGGATSLFEAGARERALETRERQEEIATQQRQLLQGQQLNRILAQQNVAQSASGTTLSSPSFAALQRASFNEFAQDANADNLNLSFQKEALEQQKRNAMTEGFLQAGTSLFNIGNDMRNLRVPGVEGTQTAQQGQQPPSGGFGQPFDNMFNQMTNPFPDM